MKEVKIFMFAGCPHCAKAGEMVKKLKETNMDYASVPIDVIDEKLKPAEADKYDYYYVPTFFVGGVKLHEGVPTEEAVEKVLKAALA